MSEYYQALRHIHVACAILTIALFTLRGALMLLDSPWQRSAVLRFLPHAVDTVLLTSALMLAAAIRQYPFAVDWLTAKVVLLTIYVVLGSVALKRGRTRRLRAVAFGAALVTVAFLVSVARAHHPLGILAG